MHRQPHSRRLLILSLIAILVSVLSFVNLPTATRAASGEALIARAQYSSYGSRTWDALLAMDAADNTTTRYTPASLGTATYLPFFGASYPAYVFITSSRLEVTDLATGADTFYPLPPDSGNSSTKAAGVSQPNLLSADFFANGSQVLLNFGDYSRSIIYLLDLASGAYTHVPLTAPSGTHYAPMGQAADGMIYANVAEGRDGKVPDVVRFDLQGNVQPVNFNTGKYMRGSVPTISPAGKYLYFTALDPDQQLPPQSGPGFDSNVIMRYRISDGTSKVIVRARPGDIIGDFTLTSNDPDISYTEIVPAPYHTGDFSWKAQQVEIKRLNLATFAPPETLINNASVDNLLWCGSTLYYDTYDGSKYLTSSFDPTSGATAQAEGQLLGCAP